jgi:hypothetical protein
MNGECRLGKAGSLVFNTNAKLWCEDMSGRRIKEAGITERD